MAITGRFSVALVVSAMALAAATGCADDAVRNTPQDIPDGLWVAPGEAGSPRVPFVRNGYYGYLDAEGRVALPPLYDWADDFRGGYALCTRKHRRSIIDEKGAEKGVLPTSAESCFRADVDRVWYAVGEKWGLCDLAGNVLIKPTYDDVDAFSDSLARVNIGAKWDPPGVFSKIGGKNGYVDRHGKLVIPCQFDHCFAFHEGFARVDDNLMDREGKVVLQDPRLGFVISEGLIPLHDYRDDAGSFSTQYVDATGAVKFSVTGYGEGFSDGLALVRQNDRTGYVDRHGEWVIPPRFVRAESFQNGLACVSLIKEQWGYIDAQGTPVTPTHFNEGEPAEDRYAIVHYGGKLQEVMDAPRDWIGGRWLMIDRSGRPLAVIREDGPGL